LYHFPLPFYVLESIVTAAVVHLSSVLLLGAWRTYLSCNPGEILPSILNPHRNKQEYTTFLNEITCDGKAAMDLASALELQFVLARIWCVVSLGCGAYNNNFADGFLIHASTRISQ
jgi:hypothetical protein